MDNSVMKRQNIYENTLQFQGRWRTYQKRVLDNSGKYLADHKIHIVAAPGSGKTTLGIELIRRLGEPCLILSPSITIRQQWLERIKESFLLEGYEAEKILSNDLKNMRLITAVTYQALYSAMKNDHGCLEEGDLADDSSEKENVDFRNFELLDAIQAAKVKTVCLDEAHHLRSEWWKALEKFMEKLEGISVISLTATPPYDSTPGQWKRYIDLCGPIDEEIFTPELVKDGSLCPHEDYIFFNWPTKAEEKKIKEYRKTVEEFRKQLLEDFAFSDLIASHKGLKSPQEYGEKFLENPSYFSSFLIFCQSQKIPLPQYLLELIGTDGYLPGLNDHWLEILLQGFLFEDTKSYQVSHEEREKLIKRLKEAGCIHRNRVSLTGGEELSRLLVKSQGKMESIRKIAEAEYQALGADLRLLILCDYIKKESLSRIGTEKELITEIGAVPIFEYLRRSGREGIRLGCLSGSVIIVPLDVKRKLEKLLEEKECAGVLTPLRDTGYGQLQVRGKNVHAVSVVTELFRAGDIQILIGTKSLLGEGWDAPCVNSLILATYVGAFMLSNQMRGRTIRTDPENPEKTGNIWHLACVYPDKRKEDQEEKYSGDYETLIRRFESFLGVSWEEPVIESGIGRLAIPEFDSPKKMAEVNQMMLCRAGDRDGLRGRWESALKEIHGDMEIEQAEVIPKEKVKVGYLFYHALGFEILSLIMAGISFLGRIFLTVGYQSDSSLAKIWGLLMVLAFFGVARYGIRLFRFSTPQKRMEQFSQAILEALIEIGEIEFPQNCRTEVESAKGILIATWLKGGSMRDRTTFACCMEEIWSIIDNPRYLLVKRKRIKFGEEYYCVPEIFGRQKERAEIFEKHMQKVLGRYRIVYTRTPEGRQILLRARTRSFVNKNQKVLLGRKVAKGKYE